MKILTGMFLSLEGDLAIGWQNVADARPIKDEWRGFLYGLCIKGVQVTDEDIMDWATRVYKSYCLNRCIKEDTELWVYIEGEIGSGLRPLLNGPCPYPQDRSFKEDFIHATIHMLRMEGRIGTLNSRY